MVETGRTWRTAERGSAVGVGAGQEGRQGKGNLWEQGAGKKGWPGSFWPEERPGGPAAAACVGWGRGAGQGWPRERVAERLGEGRTSALEVPCPGPVPEAPAGKPEPVGPPPPQSSGAKRSTTFTTSGG